MTQAHKSPRCFGTADAVKQRNARLNEQPGLRVAVPLTRAARLPCQWRTVPMAHFPAKRCVFPSLAWMPFTVSIILILPFHQCPSHACGGRAVEPIQERARLRASRGCAVAGPAAGAERRAPGAGPGSRFGRRRAERAAQERAPVAQRPRRLQRRLRLCGVGGEAGAPAEPAAGLRRGTKPVKVRFWHCEAQCCPPATSVKTERPNPPQHSIVKRAPSKAKQSKVDNEAAVRAKQRELTLLPWLSLSADATGAGARGGGTVSDDELPLPSPPLVVAVPYLEWSSVNERDAAPGLAFAERGDAGCLPITWPKRSGDGRAGPPLQPTRQRSHWAGCKHRTRKKETHL